MVPSLGFGKMHGFLTPIVERVKKKYTIYDLSISWML